MDTLPSKIAIIAGEGTLPRELHDACIEHNIDVHIVGLQDQFDVDLFDGIKFDLVPIYGISQIIKSIKKSGAKYIILAGKVTRSSIPKLILDFKGAKLLANILRNGLSDTSLTQTIIKFLENENFEVISPEIIAENILATPGNMTKIQIKKSHIKDMEQGYKMLGTICKLDVGQALVIQNGLILGIEAVEGTDDLIKRSGLIQQKINSEPVLIKRCKPHQDKRMDMPCIGEKTIKNMCKFGIKGIGLESGACLILNKGKTLSLANECGIFIYGLK